MVEGSKCVWEGRGECLELRGAEEGETVQPAEGAVALVGGNKGRAGIEAFKVSLL